MSVKNILFILLTISFGTANGIYFDLNNPEEMGAGTQVIRCTGCGSIQLLAVKIPDKKDSLTGTSTLACAFENHALGMPCCMLIETEKKIARCQICCRSCCLGFSNTKDFCCCGVQLPIDCCCCSKGSSTKDMER